MHRRRPIALLLAWTAILQFTAAPALANPQGGQVVGGSASIDGTGTSTVTVTQSTQNAVINWQSFNIGSGETTNFVQPNSTSTVLNRVIGDPNASQIFGTLNANGRVFLVNPNGVLIGNGASINTAGFLATTHDISNADFMAGNYNFNIAGNPSASVVNLGTITATNAGFAALVAPGVRNSGTITATLGQVALASGNGFTLDPYGDQLITLSVSDSIASQVTDVATGQTLQSLVRNDGTLSANGGRVELSAVAARQVVDSVINNTGVIEARSIGTQNGKIVLGAATAATKPAGAPKQTVKLSGTLDVSSAGGKGGTVQVTGEDIQVTGATINASGFTGGGKVLIGGDIGGGNPLPLVMSMGLAELESYAIANATTVSVDGATVIDASATGAGDGGKVIVWADGATAFSGTILARGGTASGDGGFVEVSGKQTLAYLGTSDLRAPNGLWGTLLLDPYNVTITNTVTLGGGFSGGDPNVFTPTSDDSVISVTDLEFALGTANVVVTTGTDGSQPGNITVASAVTWSSGSTLTLQAANDIAINGNITAEYGGLTIAAGGEITATGDVNVSRFTLQNGDWVQNPLGLNPLPAFSATDFRITGGSFLRVKDGDGDDATAFEIVDIYGLQGIGSSADFLDKRFALVNDINASVTATWNDGKGFKPIAGPFVGELDGQGHTIDGLTIKPNDSTTNTIGLFGMIGQSGSDVGRVHHVAFVNATVEANPSLSFGVQSIGILAGINAGEIDHVTVGGTIDTGAKAGVVVGGLVGMNAWISNTNTTLAGSIGDTSSSAVITVGDGELCLTTCSVGHNFAGGLVGINPGTIEDSFATGNVVVGSNSNAGGLVGANQRLFGTTNDVQPTIQNSYATGNVSSAGVNVQLGGLVGVNHGDYYDQASSGWIVDSRASGDVIATAAVNNFDCSISPTNCQYANVGGLVGMNRGTITGTDPPVIGFYGPAFGSGTYATGAVHVGSNGNAGGLVGYNEGLIEHAKATGAVTGDAGAPGIPGDVGGTTLGGLVGVNLGEIEDSSATGTVGALGVANLTVGGLAGASPGWIYDSWASGAVMAGNYSVAGGLAGESAPFDSVACPNCIRGVAFNNLGWIWESTASGAVTVGDISVAGGLVGFSGSIFDSIADGNVLGGIDSILGGLAGVIPTWTFVEDSIANGSVTGGSNSWIGGFAGVNAGMVFADLTASTPSGSTGAVQGDSNSVIGGFVGLNIGGIFGASPATSSDVTATGTGNIVGGLVGANFGGIMGADAYGDVNAAVPGNTVGSLAGANGTIANVMPLQVPGSSFPFGQIASSTGYGTVNYPNGGPQIGSTSLAALPTPPAVLNACNDALCQILKNPALIPSLDIPEDLFGFLIFLSFLDPPPPPDNNPPIVLASLDQPGPPPPGPNPIGPNGTIQNAVPGQPTFTPPPLPRRTVMGLGGETVSGMPPLNETRFVPNQVLLHMNINLPTDQLVAAAQRLGIRILTNESLTNLGQRLINLQLPPGMTVRQAIRLMEQNSNFPLATINGVYTTTQPAAAAPRGDPAQYTIGKLGLDRAHQVATGRGVTIAVIDSEVDKKHGELQGAVAEELNALGAKEAPHSHGTAMAGAIASRDRLLGVAPDAKILAVRAFGEGANTAEGTTVTIIKGIEWAVSQGAKVINMSFAGPRDPSLERALKAARDRGVVLIAAAGNAGPKSPPLYPAADPNVIAVTATDSRDRIFRGANQGPQVSVAAPGVEILAPAPDAAYQMSTGTSIATAHVSGVVALLLERDPNLKPADVRRILEETATGLGPRGKNTQFGWGLVNPGKALEVVTARVKTSGATVGGR